MKENELRKHAECALCRKKIGHTGLPLFWRVTVERYGINANAVQRQDGLGAFLGNSFLANIMGPDEDLAAPVMEPVTLTVCESCALNKEFPIAVFAEHGR